jgi:molybdate transport system ATP-binding protein
MRAGLNANFAKRFGNGPEIRVEDLRTTERDGITVLFGASGAGKTTVLRCLAGLERPDEGSIYLGESAWVDVGSDFFLPARERQVGFVPQDYALFPHLSVEHNVGYGLNKLSSSQRHQRISEALALVQLEGVERRLPHELSGGQQQRVALARAIVRQPCLLLLDEPLSALDLPTRQRLRGELRVLLKQLGIPTLLVTHDRTEAMTLGEHLAVMHEGKMVQQGTVPEVFSHPANLDVAAIVAVETVQLGCIVERGELATVTVRGVKLTALGRELPATATEVYVCIRAEDVILVKGEPAKSSPRNALRGKVCALTPEGPMRRIELDCGFPLMALLTKQACEDLALEPGVEVMALIKAPQIHLIPR